METTTPEYYTEIRICAYCKAYFTEGENLGTWNCIRHLRKRAFFHPQVPPTYVCCATPERGTVTAMGDLITGCVRHDHEDDDMTLQHAESVLQFGVNIDIQPRIVFTHLGVPRPAARSIIAEVDIKQMRSWLEGENLDATRLEVGFSLGKATLDLFAIGKEIAARTLRGPYATIARSEGCDMSISKEAANAYVRAESEFRSSLPKTDEGGAVVTHESYYADRQHQLKEEIGSQEAISFIIYSREDFQRIPLVETAMNRHLREWNCNSLGEWHRRFAEQLQDVLFTQQLVIV